MVYTSRKRNFRRFIKTHNLKYYFAFLAMVLAIVAAVIVITKNNGQNRPQDKTGETSRLSDNTTADETDIAPENVRGVYRLCLNLATGQMSVYEWDGESESFSKEAKRHMLFAAKNVKEGEYASPFSQASKSAWSEAAKGGRFYRYVTDFDGKIIFHSADYETLNDRNSLIADSYAAIESGEAKELSDGVTLTVADAKWIYENCSFDSEISIYSDAGETRHEPANRIIEIPEDISWEPTDASNGTPWCQTEISELSTLPELEVTTGLPQRLLFNVIKGVDIDGRDVTEYVYLTGELDLNKPGVYYLTYELIDIFGNHLSQPLKLTVKEPETTPPADQTTETEPDTAEAEETTGEKSSEDATEPIADDTEGPATTEQPTDDPAVPTDPETQSGESAEPSNEASSSDGASSEADSSGNAGFQGQEQEAETTEEMPLSY